MMSEYTDYTYSETHRRIEFYDTDGAHIATLYFDKITGGLHPDSWIQSSEQTASEEDVKP